MGADAELDELTTMLKAIALQKQPSGTTLVEDQLASIATRLNRGSRTFSIRAPGVNGYKGAELLSVDLSEKHPMTGKQLTGAQVVPPPFATAQVESTLKIVEPFPSLLIQGSFGPFGASTDGQTTEIEGVMTVTYRVDCVVFAPGDFQNLTQRRSLILATAFLRALRLDESLGGLVHRIYPLGTIEPGGGGKYGKNPHVMATRIRMEAMATLPY